MVSFCRQHALQYSWVQGRCWQRDCFLWKKEKEKMWTVCRHGERLAVFEATDLTKPAMVFVAARWRYLRAEEVLLLHFVIIIGAGKAPSAFFFMQVIIALHWWQSQSQNFSTLCTLWFFHLSYFFYQNCLILWTSLSIPIRPVFASVYFPYFTLNLWEINVRWYRDITSHRWQILICAFSPSDREQSYCKNRTLCNDRHG